MEADSRRPVPLLQCDAEVHTAQIVRAAEAHICVQLITRTCWSYVVQLLHRCAGAKAAAFASMPFSRRRYQPPHLGKHASLDLDDSTDGSLEVRSPASVSTEVLSRTAGLPRCLGALPSTDLGDFDVASDREVRSGYRLYTLRCIYTPADLHTSARLFGSKIHIQVCSPPTRCQQRQNSESGIGCLQQGIRSKATMPMKPCK